MADGALARVRVDAAALPPSASWADGLEVTLPTNLARRIASGEAQASGDLGRSEAVGAAALRDRRAYLTSPPASGRLPISYRSVPGPIRRMIVNAIGRVQSRREASWAAFPSWPLDLSADFYADISSTPTICCDPPTPVLLTHDIDSPEGLDNLVQLFLPIEEQAGACSANFIVPCAWPVDEGLVRETLRRGHEIGVHGFDHSNRTAFASSTDRRERLAAGCRFATRFDARGYRAPSLVRSRELLADLDGLYIYDSSIPTSGGPFPVGNNGCASARPWRIGGVWELPLSLPRDGSLRFLGHGPDEIASMWLKGADRICRAKGVVNLLTHCEFGFSGNKPMLAAYSRFLMTIAADARFAFVLPRQLVARLEQGQH